MFVIHLKRLLPGKKVNTKVSAPLKNFDPTPFLATSILKKQEETRRQRKKKNVSGSDDTKSSQDDTALKEGESHTGLYDLYATVNHFGTSHGGHYTAYALNRTDNKWYLFDDARVTALPSDHPIITQNTYMLFYQRHGLEGEHGLDFMAPDARAKFERLVKEHDSGGVCTIS